MLTMPVFFFPSTIITIDDDLLFLKSLNLLLPQFTLQQFCKPKEVLNFFNNYHSPLTRINFLKSYTDYDFYSTSKHMLVDFDLPCLYELSKHREIENEISVIIVDYHMQEMNGIQLCQTLRHLPIKKILLTGQADHSQAITAFNDNVIDCFIQKDSPNLAQEIQFYTRKMAEKFYYDFTQPMLSHISVDTESPLTDPVFIKFFNALIVQYQIKSYSLIDKSGSLIIVNDQNEYFCLIVHTNHSLNLFIEINDDVPEVKEYLFHVDQKSLIPFFGIGEECWKFEPREWFKFFFKPQLLEGRECYYWAILKLEGNL
ncbi:MAG: hypothetical protein H0W64_05165 [Gammaproteobacteria bacterium]|nr:hypothetical protein [Gammaproteobacteria bacterium]